MRIEIYHDVICPWCAIGKARFDKALAQCDPDSYHLIWRPFQLNPWMPEAGMDRQTYLSAKFGGPERAQQAYSGVFQAAAADNLVFNLEAQRHVPNTLNAHRLILAVEGQKIDTSHVVDLIHAAYFAQGEDLGDRQILARIAEDAGLPNAEIDRLRDTDSGRSTVQASDAKARAIGIQGVPCFVINSRYALSGAQAPEAFEPLFALAGQEPTPFGLAEEAAALKPSA